MLFEEEEFRWQRLESLISSASLQSQLDLDSLLDGVLDFLFSNKGGLLRQQLVDAIVERMDALAWHATQKLTRRLPRRLQPPGLRDQPPTLFVDPLLDLAPVRQLITILRALPGFNPRMLMNRLPRLLNEPDLRSMGVDLAKGLAERGMVRLVRDVLVRPNSGTVNPLVNG